MIFMISKLFGKSDGAQVVGDGLVEGEDFEALLLKVDLVAVDVLVLAHDLAGEFGVAGVDGQDGLADILLDHGGEAEDLLLEALDLLVEMDGHGGMLLSLLSRSGR